MKRFWQEGLLFLLFLLIIAAALFVTRPAHGAPVPKPPPITDATLVGTWRQNWGEMRGTVKFWPDGSYRFDMDESTTSFVGRWWVQNGALALREFYFCTRTGDAASRPNSYEITLAGDGARLYGRTNHGTPFVLTDHQP